MAACLITVSGTSGNVRIDYKDGIISKYVISSIGTLYLESTITNVTYTNLFGDASVSSLCLTITNLPTTCFKMYWKGLSNANYKINAIIFNNDIIPITEVSFPNSGTAIISEINSLNDSRFKLKYYLINNASAMFSNDISSVTYSYIIETQGTTPPQFRVKNADNTGYIYIHGVVSTCAPVGYTEVNTCEATTLL